VHLSIGTVSTVRRRRASSRLGIAASESIRLAAVPPVVLGPQSSKSVSQPSSAAMHTHTLVKSFEDAFPPKGARSRPNGISRYHPMRPSTLWCTVTPPTQQPTHASVGKRKIGRVLHLRGNRVCLVSESRRTPSEQDRSGTRRTKMRARMTSSVRVRGTALADLPRHGPRVERGCFTLAVLASLLESERGKQSNDRTQSTR